MNGDLEYICLKLEDDDYIRDTSLASGLQTFKAIVETLPAYKDLCVYLQNNPSGGRALAGRMYRLLANGIPTTAHAHPRDTTIAIYLLALQTIPDDAYGLFWASSVSKMKAMEV